ncbi:MAG: type II toxin-antitoxin system RelE/ParE family toxin [Flavobacteriales bacterium]|nr:type II toxin-antitoxin system RelE/ParE family toxin [Flavobacteriales bacterium]MCB9447326.1 type II toxin-antitoxin system RelE/ParE family toxin [Flavobacteriales bacterium]
MSFKIKIEQDAHSDIQHAIDWYNQQQPGLGRKFHAQVKTSFSKLRTNPFFQIRYENIHCLPLKKFPFMVHFTIDEKGREVTVLAIFHTSLNPEGWKKRK